jgi:predicted ATPase
MDNQHKKIKGYRDLSQQEINLMNEIKNHGEKTKHLITSLKMLRLAAIESDVNDEILTATQYRESFRCLGLAMDNLQTGQMWFVRAVALPDSF